MKTVIATGGMYVFFTQTAFAQCAPDQYELIAPIGTLSGCVNLTGYLDGIMTTLIGIAGVLAVVMIVVCGIQLMTTGSAGGKSAAKECITNAIFGVLLAIGAFLLLNTINPLLLKKTSTLQTIETPTTPAPAGPVVELIPTTPGVYFRYIDAQGNTRNSPRYDTIAICMAKSENEKNNGTTVQNYGNPQRGCFEISKAPPAAGETATRQALCGDTSCVNEKPIGINTHACRFDGDTASCTNVDGLGGASVNTIKNLQSACGCNIIITGGTEYWKHKTHAKGSGVFDLRWDGDNTALANTIKSQGGFKPSFSGNKRWLYNGFWYTDEVSSKARHWHVCPAGAPYNFCN